MSLSMDPCLFDLQPSSEIALNKDVPSVNWIIPELFEL